jgi:hypothetical protein
MGVGSQRHAPAALPAGKTGTHCKEGWVGPRAGLDGCGKSRSLWDSIPGPSSLYRVAIPTELSEGYILPEHWYGATRLDGGHVSKKLLS